MAIVRGYGGPGDRLKLVKHIESKHIPRYSAPATVILRMRSLGENELGANKHECDNGNHQQDISHGLQFWSLEGPYEFQ